MPARGAARFVAWFALLFAVTQWPLYAVDYPDIEDFTNHLARLHVLLNLPGSAALQQFYEMRALPLRTNLAMDVVVPLLSRAMPLALALKVFASLATLALASGAAALGAVNARRFDPLLLGVLLFANSKMLQFGLFNYLLGAGTALWLLAAWLGFARRGVVGRLVGFNLGCAALFTIHLGGLAVYALGMVGLLARDLSMQRAAGKPVDRRELGLGCAQFALAALLYLSAAGSRGSVVAAAAVDAGWQLVFETVVYKVLLLAAAPSLAVSGYAGGQLVLGLALVQLLMFGAYHRWWRLDPAHAWIGAALVLAVTLLPRSGLGSNLLDSRLSLVLCLVAWAGLRSRGHEKAVLGMVMGGVVATSASMAWEWHARDAEYRQVRAALREVEVGAKVAIVSPGEADDRPRISVHAAAWSVIDRSAFVSNLYVWPFQPFPVAYREPFAAEALMARSEPTAVPPTAYDPLAQTYDYVLVFSRDAVARHAYAPAAPTMFEADSVRIVCTGRLTSAGSAGMCPGARPGR